MKQKTKLELPDDITEQLVINRLLTSELHALSMLPVFDSRWFEDQDYQVIAKLVIEYFRRFAKHPAIQTFEKILLKYSQLHSLNFDELFKKLDAALKITIHIEEPEYSDQVIVEFIRRRGIYFTIMDNLDHIEKRKDVSKIISKFGDLSTFNLDQDLGLDCFDMKAHKSASEVTRSRIPTGINEFDTQFGGGLYKSGKCLWVPVGMPGIGKTALLTNLAALAVSRGERPLVFTMEIDQDLYLKRIDANILKIKISDVQNNFNEIEKMYKKIKKINSTSGLIIKEFAPRTVSCTTLKLFIERLRLTGFVPTIILIDYLNLLIPFSISADSTMYERVGAIAQEIRALSYTFPVPIIAPTQFNTEGFSGEPRMEMIAESRAVAHHADAITAFWQSETDREQGLLNFKNLKNRLGGIINIGGRLKINYDSLSISSLNENTNKPVESNNTSITNNQLKALLDI